MGKTNAVTNRLKVNQTILNGRDITDDITSTETTIEQNGAEPDEEIRRRIQRGLATIFRPGDTIEILNVDKPIRVGRYKYGDPELLNKLCTVDAQNGAVVFYLLNPTTLPPRPYGVVQFRDKKAMKGECSGNADMACWHWIVLDIDHKAHGRAATDQEHDEVIAVMQQAREFLEAEGFEGIVLASSGNGGHLLIPVDLPKDSPKEKEHESKRLVQEVQAAIREKFKTDSAEIQAFPDIKRAVRSYGTLNRKGDDPSKFRRSGLLSDPKPGVNSRELLESFVAKFPSTTAAPIRRFEGDPDKPGPFTEEMMYGFLDKIEEVYEDFTYESQQNAYNGCPGALVLCPGGLTHTSGAEGWLDGEAHSDEYDDVLGGLSSTTIVSLQNGWICFFCWRGHCDYGADHGKKSWRDFRNWFDPTHNLYPLPGDDTSKPYFGSQRFADGPIQEAPTIKIKGESEESEVSEVSEVTEQLDPQPGPQPDPQPDVPGQKSLVELADIVELAELAELAASVGLSSKKPKKCKPASLFPTYPLDVWKGTAYADYAALCGKGNNIPPEFHIEALKTITGAIVGRALNVHWIDGGTARFYTVLIAPPGSGKGTAIDYALQVFKFAETDGLNLKKRPPLLWPQATKPEDVAWVTIGACRGGFASDAGMQRVSDIGHHRWLQVYEELYTLVEKTGIQSSGQSLLGANRQLYDREDFATTATATRLAASGEAQNTILGASTHELYESMFAGTSSEGSGLFQRFNLIAHAGTDPVSTLVAPDLARFSTDFGTRVIDLEKNHRSIPASQRAKDVLRDWWEQEKFKTGDPEKHKRLNVLAWRNALHLSWLRDLPEIGEAEMLGAIKLSDYQYEMRQIFKPASGNNPMAVLEDKLRNLLIVVRATAAKENREGRIEKGEARRRLHADRAGIGVWERVISNLVLAREAEVHQETTGQKKKWLVPGKELD